MPCALVGSLVDAARSLAEMRPLGKGNVGQFENARARASRQWRGSRMQAHVGAVSSHHIWPLARTPECHALRPPRPLPSLIS